MNLFTLLDELQSIAKTGLHYTQDAYDQARCTRLLELATYLRSYPEAFRMFTTHLTTWPEYAAVRAQEMVELTATAEAAHLQPVMAPGAAQIITALAQLPWDPEVSSEQAALARQLPVQELIPLLASKGLRQATGEPAR